VDIPAPPAEHRLRVLVDLPRHSRLDAVLDYLAPEPWPAGTLVRVPLGKREVCGIVWGAAEGPDRVEGDDGAPALRSVLQALTALPPFTAGWLRLVGFAASYYQRSPGEVGLSALPPDLRDLDAVQLARRLKRLDKALAAAAKVAAALTVAPDRPALSPEQQTVLDTLAAVTDGPQQPSLLFGATGSGKTEVYLREAEHVLAAGRQALVLVPEINLTPQLEARFAERFPDRCLVSLHSGLTPAQRLQHWLSAHLGHADLVLGTRMAVFASMPRLGLIVVDEEHDPSYKQQEGARYSARDLAVWRGRNEQVPVLLGSATPSLESWYNAGPVESGGGRYRRLVMPSRIGGGNLPVVRLVDLSRIAAQFGKQALRQHRWLRRCWTRCASGSTEANRASCCSTAGVTRRCCIARTAAGKAPARTAAPGASSTSSTAPCAATTAASPSGCRAPAPTAATLTSSPWAAAPSGWRSSSPTCCRVLASVASTPTAPAPRAAWKPSSPASMRVKWMCSSARRWSPRATTSAA
jgi:primosomal protein N' (replication factor Y)